VEPTFPIPLPLRTLPPRRCTTPGGHKRTVSRAVVDDDHVPVQCLVAALHHDARSRRHDGARSVRRCPGRDGRRGFGERRVAHSEHGGESPAHGQPPGTLSRSSCGCRGLRRARRGRSRRPGGLSSSVELEVEQFVEAVRGGRLRVSAPPIRTAISSGGRCWLSPEPDPVVHGPRRSTSAKPLELGVQMVKRQVLFGNRRAKPATHVISICYHGYRRSLRQKDEQDPRMEAATIAAVRPTGPPESTGIPDAECER